MAKNQITDLNPSDFASMEELTDEELLEINGGGFWSDIGGFGYFFDKITRPIIFPILPVFFKF